jgi:DNA repair exonuclease SbcCD ATPase subunit
VRTDGAIGAPATVVRDDQSEIVMLQEVIDELTTEKLGLVRGLQKSQLTVDELASENSALTQRYNETKSQLSHARSELDRLWMQYQAKCGDGDGMMMSNPDASERVQALAAEVVNLEERLHEFAETKEDNERLRLEAKRSNARATEAELVLEATREQLRLFKERIRDSELMKTLDTLEEDDAILLCAWLRQSEAEAEREAKEDASSVEKKTRDDVDVANDVDDEQIELLASINELLGQLENEKKSLARQLGSANEAKQQLAERNELLESQLAKALDRLALVDENWSEEEEVVKPRRGLLSFFRR